MSVLTSQRGAHPIDLDRRRVLFFDMAATFLLVEKYGPGFAASLYTVERVQAGEKTHTKLTLRSGTALQYFLFAGLQAEAREQHEELTLEGAGEFIRPWNIPEIFNKLVLALSGATHTPAEPGTSLGKSPAAPARATRAAAKKASPAALISRKRRGSH